MRYGRYQEFISTACIVNLSFLGCGERGHPEKMLPQIERWEGTQGRDQLKIRMCVFQLFFTRWRFLNEQSRRTSSTFKKIFGRTFPTESATGNLSRKRVSIRGSIKRSRSMIVSDSSEGDCPNLVYAVVRIKVHTLMSSGGPSPTYSKQSSIDDDDESHHTTPSASGYERCLDLSK